MKLLDGTKVRNLVGQVFEVTYEDEYEPGSYFARIISDNGMGGEGQLVAVHVDEISAGLLEIIE